MNHVVSQLYRGPHGPRSPKLFLIVVFAALANSAGAQDFAELRQHNWHQWRGPHADGVAPHGDPPTHWDETTNVCWKCQLPGIGSSTPIVWQDHIFILAARETDRAADPDEMAAILEANEGQRTTPPAKYLQYLVIDVDRRTGEIRWQRTATEAIPHEGRHKTNTFASASPLTDGRYVYASFGSRGIYCYDFDGNLQWQRDLGDMRTRRGWGEGVSPALHNGTLLVNWDHEGDSFLVAMDANTGETSWKVDRDEPTSWSTPFIVRGNGRMQVVVNATNRVRSYDLDSGQLLWECGGQNTNVISCPVATEDTVFCMSSYGKSTVHAIPLSASGDITDSDDLAWQYERLAPYCPSPLLYDNYLYFTRSNSTLLTSLDTRTGETVLPPTRLPLSGSMYASPVGAAGRVYIVDRDGATVVLRHADEFEVLATNRLDDPIDASPAIVGRQMFLRGRKFLYCLEEDLR